MATPVVTVASGGLAVVEVAAGLPVSEAPPGRGIAVTKVIGKPGLGVTFVVESSGGAPAAPLTGVLTLLSASSDNTPDFTYVAADLALGDVVRFQYDDNSGFTSPAEITSTIDAAADAANELDFSTGPLADGLYYFRARTERTGHPNGAWSNTQTYTISTVSGPTWDPAHTGSSARITLSGSNLIATVGSSPDNGSNTRVTTSHTGDGTWYIRATVGSGVVSAHDLVGIGIANSLFVNGNGGAGQWFGGTGNGGAWFSSGSVYEGGTAIKTWSTYQTGDLLELLFLVSGGSGGIKRMAGRVNGGNWNGNVANNPNINYWDAGSVYSLNNVFFVVGQVGEGSLTWVNGATPPSGSGAVNW